MFCKNCGKEIGMSQECSYCGYNPTIDNGLGNESMQEYTVSVPPLQITLKKGHNGKATAGFVFGFFSFCFIPFGILSFIFSLVGFFQAKKYRSGRGKAIFGLLFSSFWAAVWLLYIYLAVKGQGY